MILRLIAVGKLRTPFVAEACALYRKRLAPYFRYEEVEVRTADGSDAGEAMRQEGARVLRLVNADDCVWLLERSGMTLTSEGLAREVDRHAQSGASRLTLVVSGTYGSGSALRERANFLWSLSDLTFLHEWARMIVLEQLYRAAKIGRNEPYHH